MLMHTSGPGRALPFLDALRLHHGHGGRCVPTLSGWRGSALGAAGKRPPHKRCSRRASVREGARETRKCASPWP